jgi:hypothetical protein
MVSRVLVSNHRSGNLDRGPGRLNLQSFSPDKYMHLIKFAPEPSLRREASSGGDHLSAGLVERSGSAGRSSKPSKVRVSSQHENSHELAQAIAQVSNTLKRFWLIAEHWSVEQRWTLLFTHVFRHWLGGKWLEMLPPEAESLLSG